MQVTLSNKLISFDDVIEAAAQGEPEAPMCGFSNIACRILDAYSEPQADFPISKSNAAKQALERSS